MGDDNSGSGHGWLDHLGEASDILGTGAGVLQGADAGGVRKLPSQFLPQMDTFGVDNAGLLAFDEAGSIATTQPTLRATGALNGIGAVTSGLGAVTGGLDMTDDTKSTADRAVGAGNFLTGIIGTAGSIGGFGGTTVSPFVQGLASSGGAAGLGGEAFAGATWGAGATGGAAAGTALATGASVVGAGLAGYGLGKYADDHTKDTGWFKDENGKNRSMTDATAAAGCYVDDGIESLVGGEEGSLRAGFGDFAGDVLGVGTVGLGSILGTIAAPAIAAHGVGSATVNGAMGLGRAAVGASSSFMDWCHGATK